MIRISQRASFAVSKFSVSRLHNVKMMNTLVKNQALINGQWTGAQDNGIFNVINPANQKVLGSVPDMKVVDVQQAIDAAHATFYSKQWQNTTAKDRSGMLKVTFIMAHFEFPAHDSNQF